MWMEKTASIFLSLGLCINYILVFSPGSLAVCPHVTQGRKQTAVIPGKFWSSLVNYLQYLPRHLASTQMSPLCRTTTCPSSLCIITACSSEHKQSPAGSNQRSAWSSSLISTSCQLNASGKPKDKARQLSSSTFAPYCSSNTTCALRSGRKQA